MQRTSWLIRGRPRILRLARSQYGQTLIRPLSTTPPRFSSLTPPIPLVSTQLPCDAFQLLPESKKPFAEDRLFEAQIVDVQKWWASDRYAGIKRPYSAEDVVSKRGTLQQIYPSSLMARKLFNLFRERAAKGEPVHTRTYDLFPFLPLPHLN